MEPKASDNHKIIGGLLKKIGENKKALDAVVRLPFFEMQKTIAYKAIVANSDFVLLKKKVNADAHFKKELYDSVSFLHGQAFTNGLFKIFI